MFLSHGQPPVGRGKLRLDQVNRQRQIRNGGVDLRHGTGFRGLVVEAGRGQHQPYQAVALFVMGQPVLRTADGQQGGATRTVDRHRSPGDLASGGDQVGYIAGRQLGLAALYPGKKTGGYQVHIPGFDTGGGDFFEIRLGLFRLAENGRQPDKDRPRWRRTAHDFSLGAIAQSDGLALGVGAECKPEQQCENLQSHVLLPKVVCF